MGALLAWVIWRRGFIPGGTWWFISLITLAFGYAFFIDMSTRIWWDEDQVWWQALDYFAIYPLRRSLRIVELTRVNSAFRSVANYAPGKPFDSLVLSGSGEPIHIFPSFHRREELETLLRHLYNKRPDAFIDPLVRDFINGEFTKWWPSR